MKKTLLSLLSVFCILATVSAQTVWAPKVIVDPATGNNPYTIANGNIDGDANLDFVIGTETDHVIVWFKGNGDGTFVKQTPITNTLTNIGGVKLVDLNSDGDLDILAVGFGNYGAPFGGSSKLVWFENDGTGSFGPEQVINDTFSGMSGLFVGSIDAGATADIAVTAFADDQTIWFSNDGAGNFAAPLVIDNTLISPGVVNMKDIDNDGDLDALIATATYGGTDVVEIFRNDLVPGGSVAFTKDATSVATGKVGIFNATFEDLDGDANLDILVTEISFGGGPSGNLYWFEENGSGYTENILTTTTNNPSVAQAKDLDNDGLVDIVVSGGALVDVEDLVWFKNNGAGSFGTEQVINATQNQVYVYTVGDFDNDGDLDIVSNAYNANQVNYIENLLETLSTTDLDITSIKIHPNPAQNILNFEGFNTSIEVSVFDVLGKNVIKTALNTGETLNISQLGNGLYTININGEFASKFIKE